MRRILSLALALLLLASSLFLFASCASPVYMTVGSEDVSYDVVRSFVKMHLSGYTAEELKDEAKREEIRETVLSDLRKTYIIPNIAKELGLRLTSEMKKGIEEELDYYRNLAEFDAMLEAQFATEEVFEALMTINAYDTLVFDAITEGGALGATEGDRFSGTNEVIEADLAKGDWYAAEYVVVLQVDSVTKTMLTKARDAILAGSSFKDAVADIEKSYSADLRYRAIDECFTSTIYAEDFEKTVQSLEVGGVSEVMLSLTADGRPCYMLIRRNALSRDYIDENYNTVISQYLTREYTLYMTERAKALEIKIAKKYENQDLLEIE